MKRRLSPRRILCMIIVALVAVSAGGCGTIRTHWGMEHDYRYDFDDDGHHHKNTRNTTRSIRNTINATTITTTMMTEEAADEPNAAEMILPAMPPAPYISSGRPFQL